MTRRNQACEDLGQSVPAEETDSRCKGPKKIMSLTCLRNKKVQRDSGRVKRGNNGIRNRCGQTMQGLLGHGKNI